MRRGLAEAGAGLPAIEPGMPLPAGTGLSRRSFLARGAGLALAVYGGHSLLPKMLEDGIAASAAGPAQRVLVSVFLDGGADSLSMLAPAEDPLYRRLRPRLALPATGTPFAEDPRLRWHPSLAPFATLHGEGKVTVLPGVGYTGPDQSHFTSRHFWEVGATDDRLLTGWLGRYLDRTGSPSNPLQGLSLESRLQPALATAKVPVASIDAPDRYDFWTRGVWGDVEKRLMQSLGELGAVPTHGDPALVQATEAVAAGGAAARAAAAVHAEERQARLHEPRRVPAGGRRIPAPARRAGGDARCRPTDPRRRAHCTWHVRHPRRPAAGARRRPRAHGSEPARLPARPRGARPRRPRPRPRVVGVRPPRGGERLERHRSRRRGHRLPRRQPGQRHDDRRVSRAWRSSTSTATSARPPTSAACTRRCSRTGSAPTPTRSSPPPARSSGRGS